MRIESAGGSGGGRGRRRHRKHHAMPMAEINIIPLVDIILVLLIIFMATTAFVKEAGLNMKLPAASTNDNMVTQENKDISIALARNGAIYLDGKPSSEAAVKAAMQQAAKTRKDTRVIIKGDENIEYKRVIAVMDMARSAGLPKVSLGTRLLDSAS